MGTVSPTPNLTEAEEAWVLQNVMQPAVAEMSRRGTPFEGFLYAGLMIAPDRTINVLEFNTRLGDPETQVILRRMESDLVELLVALSDPQLPDPPQQRWSSDAAVCVVLASAGYPASARKGDMIAGIDAAEALAKVVVFQAGTSLNDAGELVTGGGRVLNVTATGDSVETARQHVYAALTNITFQGMQHRKDIAAV
jgi:phosphoribosylamine--glycine ligase